MDERIRVIRELENKKRETLVQTDKMLESLGNSLLSRKEGGDYHRLCGEIAASKDERAKVEADMARLRELDAQIQAKEREKDSELAKLPGLYARIGGLILGNRDIESPFRPEFEVLHAKITALQEQLAPKDSQYSASANVFARLGKNAQDMMARSMLKRRQAEEERLSAQVGEQFCTDIVTNPGLGKLSGSDVQILLDEIDRIKKNAAKVEAAWAGLRAENDKITDCYRPDGGPKRKVAGLEQNEARLASELAQVCQEYGAQVEADASVDSSDGTYTPGLEKQDIELLTQVAEQRKAVADIDGQIKKLKTMIAIDEEGSKVSRLQKMREEQKAKIAAAEKMAADLSAQIEASQKRIDELSKEL